MEVSLSRMQTQRGDGRERRGQQSNGQMEADGEPSTGLEDPPDETGGEQAQGYQTLQVSEEQPEEVSRHPLVGLGEGVEKKTYIPHQTNGTVEAKLSKKQNPLEKGTRSTRLRGKMK